MSYADQLKAAIERKGVTRPTDKTDTTPFVSSVSASNDPFPPARATLADQARIRAGMMRLWASELDHPDFPEALALALAKPDMALDLLRAEGML